jgi:phosphoacetylglucosamine mutase
MDYFDKVSPIAKRYEYGTAGFRYMACDILRDVAYRVGIGAAILSVVIYNGENVGVMITASHNTVEYNGFKLIGPNCEMIPEMYEDFFENLVNCSDEIYNQFLEYVRVLKYEVIPHIVVGMDTRPSSNEIKNKFILGAKTINAEIIDKLVTTTPELHLLTGDPNFAYVKNVCCKFLRLTEGKVMKIKLTVDCANGSGSIKMYKIALILKKYITFSLINYDDFKNINNECGADYVHKHKQPPINTVLPFETDDTEADEYVVASFDGDADRLIIFMIYDNGYKGKGIDGDKIAALFATYISFQLSRGKIYATVGVIQTGYANSASTKYLGENLGVIVETSAIGVKHLHKAAKKYDIGIYYESNGHGTILFSDDFINKITNIASHNLYAKMLIGVYNLMNQKVGDAITNLLLVIHILEGQNINMRHWHNIYKNNPWKITNVKIKNKNSIIQDKIDDIVNKYPGSRIFVRPSGTEDCVKIYIESLNDENIPLIENELFNILIFEVKN